MEVGFAVMVTVGCCCCCWFTVMVVLACVDWPVLLEQVIEYVCVDVGVTVIEPVVGSLPEKPAPVIAVQLVAFVELQASVEEPP